METMTKISPAIITARIIPITESPAERIAIISLLFAIVPKTNKLPNKAAEGMSS